MTKEQFDNLVKEKREACKKALDNTLHALIEERKTKGENVTEAEVKTIDADNEKFVARLGTFHGKYSAPAIKLFRFLLERGFEICQVQTTCTCLMADLGQTVEDREAEISASGKVTSITLSAVQKATKVKGTTPLAAYLYMMDYERFTSKWGIEFNVFPNLEKLLNPAKK
jgi:hypothetical protein